MAVFGHKHFEQRFELPAQMQSITLLFQQPAWITRWFSARTPDSGISQTVFENPRSEGESSRNREPNGVRETLI